MTMTCEDARGLLIDRLLDELDAEEGERLDTHLAGCPDCRTAAGEMSEVWEALDALRAPAADPAAMIRFGRRMERRRSRPHVGVPVQVAAGVALLLAGDLVGRAIPAGGETGPSRGPVASAAAGPRFLLLLRGDEPERRRPRERLVEEYGAWAGRLAEAGALVSAEELDPEGGRWVAAETAVDPASAPVSGYFLVEAPSYDSAVAIARESPHAAYGGLLEVRRIVRGR